MPEYNKLSSLFYLKRRTNMFFDRCAPNRSFETTDAWTETWQQGKQMCILCTCSNFQPSDMVETICVSSSSWHCSTRYTCFTGPWGTETHRTTSTICTQIKESYFCCVCTGVLSVPGMFGSRCPVSSLSPASPVMRCCRTRLPQERLTQKIDFIVWFVYTQNEYSQTKILHDVWAK